jgi:DNA-binding transcriptional MerR regulator
MRKEIESFFGVCRMVRKSTLRRFTRRGGYEIVEKTEEGRWKNIGEASRETGLNRSTIRSLLQEYPAPPSKRVSISLEDYEQLEESLRRLKGVKRLLSNVKDRLDNSLVADLGELRARQAFRGESLEDFQLALKERAEADEKRQSILERNFDNALREFDLAFETLRRAIVLVGAQV